MSPVDPATFALAATETARWVYHCPVDGCPWEHERVAPDLALVTLDREPMRLNFTRAFDAAAKADDDACRAHLATHPVEDFLATINRLRALPDGWTAETEWSVRTDLDGGRRSYTPPMYRREHAEREAEWRPGGVVVSRPVHAGPWTEN